MPRKIIKIQDIHAFQALYESKESEVDIELDLCGSQLGDSGVRELVQILGSKAYPHKIAINLVNNAISDEGFEALADMLKSPSGAKNLSLNLLFNSASDVGAARLIDGIKYGENRERLAITYEFGKHQREVIFSLAQAVQSTQCPTDLCLQFGTVHLSNEAVCTLFSALKSVVSLKHLELHLSEQGLQDRDLDSMLTALETVNEGLSIKLFLVYNKFGFAGAERLSTFIVNNNIRAPVHLDLSQNSFGQRPGIELLYQALHANPQGLTHLSMNGPTKEITQYAVEQKALLQEPHTHRSAP